MARGTPSDKAFRFVIDGKSGSFDAYIDLIDGMDPNQKELDCRYRPINDTGKWAWLTGPTIYNSQLSTTESTDKTFDNAIAEVNAEIKKLFGGVSGDIPLKGYDRISWLIQLGLKEIDNVISRK